MRNSQSGRKDGRKGIHRSWIPLKMSSSLIDCAEAEANKAKKEHREKIQLEGHSLYAVDASSSTVARKKGRIVHSYRGYYNNWSPGKETLDNKKLDSSQELLLQSPLNSLSLASLPSLDGGIKIWKSQISSCLGKPMEIRLSTISSFTSGFCQANDKHP